MFTPLTLFNFPCMFPYTMKKGVFCNWPCNSIFELQKTLATQLQLYQNNSFSTTMQFHYNYTYDVMLMSLIVIHILKSNIWHYEKIWTLFFLKILIFIVHYDY
jgi:hypothetical protein